MAQLFKKLEKELEKNDSLMVKFIKEQNELDNLKVKLDESMSKRNKEFNIVEHEIMKNTTE